MRILGHSSRNGDRRDRRILGLNGTLPERTLTYLHVRWKWQSQLVQERLAQAHAQAKYLH
jgi:hypothetical protein